jgi:hypothetical protein
MYKLSIHRTSEGKYQFAAYHKMEPEEFPDFPAVLSRMIELYRLGTMSHKFWLDEPTLVDLSETEKRAVGDVRSVLIRQDELEMKVKSPDDDEIPF